MSKVETSEWQTDESGKRYRRVRGTIEYEEEILVNGVYVPVSKAESYRAEIQTSKQKLMGTFKTAKNRPEHKTCPFSSGANNDCKLEKCHLYIKNKCAIAIIADTQGIKQTDSLTTQATKCPFSVYGRCENCALNNGGCAFVRLAKQKNS